MKMTGGITTGFISRLPDMVNELAEETGGGEMAERIGQAPVTGGEPLFSAGYILYIVAFLALLLVVAWLVRWLAGKTGKMRGRYIKVLDSTYLGPNRGLYLVLVAGRLFLIGLADRYVQLLAEIDEPGFLDKVTKKGDESPFQHNTGFSHYLQGFLSTDRGKSRKEAETEPVAEKVREKITEFKNHRSGREDE